MPKVIDITDSLNKKKRARLNRRPKRQPPAQESYVDNRSLGIGVPTLPEHWFTTGHQDVDAKMIEQAKQDIETYKKNPLKFVSNELKIPTTVWRHDCPPKNWKPRPYRPYPLWSIQREILRALVKHRKVAVKSCHGSGKTFMAGIAALYLLYVWHALGVTTAPTFRQVKRLLWGEIRDIYNTAHQRGANLGGKLLQTSLELGDKWFMEGFSTDHPETNIPGFHEETVFAIMDEAGGNDPATYDMLETILTSENSFVLLIGNPIDAKSPFADCFKPGSEYKTFSIPARITPNVRNKRNVYPKLVAHDWPERMKKKWGKDSPLYKSRVEAEFPEDTISMLIPYSAITKALQTELPEDEVISFGVDVARQGSDRTVIGCRWASGKFRIIHQMERRRETEVVGTIKKLYNEYKPRCINVDDIGVGGGIVDMLFEEGFPVNGIVVSEEPDDTADDMGDLEFQNKRAQYYWKLYRAFVEDEIDIDDDELANELCYIEAKFGRKIRILEKEQIKVKLKRSPDLADCMMLAWAMDEADMEREVLRFL